MWFIMQTGFNILWPTNAFRAMILNQDATALWVPWYLYKGATQY